MAFDALADHADAQERRTVLREHRPWLLVMGVITGYMGAAPSLVWASGWFVAAAFVLLIPVAIWIYTLVFAFSALWFAHYVLAALAQLRARQAVEVVDMVPITPKAESSQAAPPTAVIVVPQVLPGTGQPMSLALPDDRTSQS